MGVGEAHCFMRKECASHTTGYEPLELDASLWALETHIDIVCEYGFTEENRGPQHVRAYISL